MTGSKRGMLTLLLGCACLLACVCIACPGNAGELVLMGAGPPSADAPIAEAPALTVLGRSLQERAAAADPRPVVRVYSRQLPQGDEFRTSCKPCVGLWHYERTHSLPFRIEWREPEAWVTGYPTLHWQDAAGNWKKRTGYNGPQTLRGIFE